DAPPEDPRRAGKGPPPFPPPLGPRPGRLAARRHLDRPERDALLPAPDANQGNERRLGVRDFGLAAFDRAWFPTLRRAVPRRREDQRGQRRTRSGTPHHRLP